MLSSRRKLILTICISCCAFILFTLTCSLAWVSQNNKVTSTSSELEIAAPDDITIQNYQIYKRDGSVDKAVKIADNSSTYSSFTFEMTEYDTVFLDRNVNTPIVIRVVLSNIDTTKAIPHMLANITCANDHFLDSSSKMQNYISNIIKIKGGIIAGNQTLNGYDPVTNADEIYNAVVNAFSSTTGSTFVNNTSFTAKSTRVTVDVDEYDIINTNQAIVYFMLDYDELLINHYIEQHPITIGDDSSASDMVYFTYDINKIEFSFVG